MGLIRGASGPLGFGKTEAVVVPRLAEAPATIPAAAEERLDPRLIYVRARIDVGNEIQEASASVKAEEPHPADSAPEV